MHIELGEVSYAELSETKPAETSQTVKERVNTARKAQQARYQNKKVYTNAQLTNHMVKTYCGIDKAGESFD